MELGGNGGFHGYHRLPRPTSGSMMNKIAADDHETSMGGPSQNHQMNNSIISNADDTSSDQCTVREQDRFMPIANVIRIMRKILPSHAKISDDAKETLQECVSEYISFVTGEANDRCQREQRKTITAEDVLWAMSKLGFDDYIEPLTLYLHRYREYDGGDRGSASLLRRPPPPALDHHYPPAPTFASIAPGYPPHAFHLPPPTPHPPAFFHLPPNINGYPTASSENGSTSQAAGPKD